MKGENASAAVNPALFRYEYISHTYIYLVSLQEAEGSTVILYNPSKMEESMIPELAYL